MQQGTRKTGYTLIETVVAIFVFSVGALALAASSSVIGRALVANTQREQAGRIASNRLEQIRAECSSASSGSEWYAGIHSTWSVGRDSVGNVTARESVTYRGARGFAADNYTGLILCDG